MEVVMAEAPGQEAVFRLEVPETTTENGKERKGLDVLDFIMNGRSEFKPKPCLDREQKLETNEFQKSSKSAVTSEMILTTSNEYANTDAQNNCCCNNSCSQFSFCEKLEELAVALNEQRKSADDNG